MIQNRTSVPRGGTRHMSALTEPKKKFLNSSIAFPDIVVVVLASYSQIPDGVVVVDALMRTTVLHRVSISTQNFREGAANYGASVRHMVRGRGRVVPWQRPPRGNESCLAHRPVRSGPAHASTARRL
jgi:hypothetical protein